jgi:hypothetical protein
MGFRTSFRDLVLPIPPRWFHDAWIAALIAAVARVAMFRNPLVKYRQHQGQAIGVENAWGLKKKKGLRGSVTDKRRTKTGAEGFRRLANTCAEVQDRLRARTAQFPGAAEAVDDLEARIRHICARAAMRNGKGRFRLIAREALSLNYQKYSTGWKSIAADAFLL